ncbi:MAG: undecaprenyl-phosphate glucose phosphotransferase [Rhodothermia bacterium]|nr:MAG: undecaprenyl-phosphate glucose phosphotransferase [Rhodothermia bacterium]
MLQEQSRLFQRLLFFLDAGIIVVAWIFAYYTRFELFPAIDFLTLPEWLPLSAYMEFLPWVLILSMGVFWASGLYIPDRAQRLSSLVYAVSKAILIGILAATASLSFYAAFNFSRILMVLFAIYTPILMVFLRATLYLVLKHGRNRGKYLRRVLIVGAGEVGERLRNAFEQYPWMGFETIGYLDDFRTDIPEWLGTTDQLTDILDEAENSANRVDYVYIALPITASDKIQHIVNEVSTRLTHVCLVPDLFQFDMMNGRVSDIDGLPVIHLVDETPLEFNRAVKRMVDLAFSGLLLTVLSPMLFLIALAVKLSSSGPVFYRQTRMGLNGKKFEMLKFRSMPVDAEKDSGAVWATKEEERATKIGAFLRKTSLDELPQFINVLKGDMSIVGPRPERPVFIDEFRNQVPRYMLRHKMKAGITGWAQVNGWRGNTSISKRIEFDIYYIRNWSLRLDLKIMLMTIGRGFVSENAY